jgi:hypothetical protein
MKNNDTFIWLSLWFAIVILGTLFFMRECQTPPNIDKVDTVFTTKTDTIWKDTTITEKEFVPKIIVKTKVDTVYTQNGDTLQLVTEAKTFEKRLISDKDTADVEVFTSGINTSLDSLKMRLKTHKEIVTNTIEITKIVEKKKTVWDRFHISLQGGYGYGFNYKGFEPYVGIGGSFDL